MLKPFGKLLQRKVEVLWLACPVRAALVLLTVLMSLLDLGKTSASSTTSLALCFLFCYVAVAMLGAEQPAASTSTVGFPFPRGKADVCSPVEQCPCLLTAGLLEAEARQGCDSMEASNHEAVCVSEKGFCCLISGVDES